MKCRRCQTLLTPANRMDVDFPYCVECVAHAPSSREPHTGRVLPKKNPHAVALGRKGGLAGKGSPARAAAARRAAAVRWAKHE